MAEPHPGSALHFVPQRPCPTGRSAGQRGALHSDNAPRSGATRALRDSGFVPGRYFAGYRAERRSDRRCAGLSRSDLHCTQRQGVPERQAVSGPVVPWGGPEAPLRGTKGGAMPRRGPKTWDRETGPAQQCRLWRKEWGSNPQVQKHNYVADSPIAILASSR